MMSIKVHDSIYEDQVREAFKVFDYVSIEEEEKIINQACLLGWQWVY